MYWLEVSFDETVRRHQQRGEATRVTAEHMRGWYTPLDLLVLPGEQIIHEPTSMADTADTFLHGSGLAHAAPRTPCPQFCPRCAEKQRSHHAGTDREAAQP